MPVIVAGPYNFTRSAQQYVTTVDDATNTAFGGERYVFSSLVQKTLSMDTRLAITFTPNSGDYSEFKEFNAPRQLRKTVYGRDRGTISATTDAGGLVTGYTVDPDGTGPAAPFSFDNPSFDARSLIGNVVYRWEYRPGSTLYLVWTQSRSDDLTDVGTLDFARDRRALFSTHPDNIFLVKLNWWLGR